MRLNGMRNIVLNKRNKLVVMPYVFTHQEIFEMGPTLLITELLERLNIAEGEVTISLNTMWRWKKNYLQKMRGRPQQLKATESVEQGQKYPFKYPETDYNEPTQSPLKFL